MYPHASPTRSVQSGGPATSPGGLGTVAISTLTASSTAPPASPGAGVVSKGSDSLDLVRGRSRIAGEGPGAGAGLVEGGRLSPAANGQVLFEPSGARSEQANGTAGHAGIGERRISVGSSETGAGVRSDVIGHTHQPRLISTSRVEYCNECGGLLDAKGCCWVCCDRLCEVCGQLTGSAFIRQCYTCAFQTEAGEVARV